jgi:hypothetical protein
MSTTTTITAETIIITTDITINITAISVIQSG